MKTSLLRLPRRQRRLQILACLISLVLLVAAVPLPPTLAQTLPVPGEGMNWSLEYNIPAPEGSMSAMTLENGRQAIEGQLAQKVTDQSVTYNVAASTADAGYRLSMSGTGGIEQLRQVVYSDLKGQMNLTAGTVDLTISGQAAQGQVVTLVLDGNATTGYVWSTNGLDPQQFALASQPDSRPVSGLLGAAQVYTIPLKAGRDGQVTGQLHYGRPWELIVAASNTLAIQFEGTLPDTIDLSNPPVSSSSTSEPAKEIQPANLGDTSMGALAVPYDYDPRPNLVTPVRNQKACGSCWAFGTVGLLESAILKETGISTDLSEQYLVSCNEYGYDCDFGGTWFANDYHQSEYSYPQKAAGAVQESIKPYTATNGTCTAAYSHPYQIGSWGQFSSDQLSIYNDPRRKIPLPSAEAVKAAIYQYGAVGTSICVNPYNSSGFNYYSNGIFGQYGEDDAYYDGTCYNTDGYYSNHAVLLVGWGHDPLAGEFFILKNSWGTGWGERGYMRVKYGASNVGYQATVVAYGQAPTIPALASPATGTILTTYTPTFQWKASPGTNMLYELQIAKSKDFSDAILIPDISTTSYTPVEGQLPDNSVLYWRVQAYKSAPNLGEGVVNRSLWSPVWTVKTMPGTVTLTELAPPVNTIRPTFSWNYVGLNAPAKYDLQISKGQSTASLVLSTTSATTSWIPTTDLPRGATIFWRVRAKGFTSGPWSAWSQEVVLPVPPTTPVLVAPLTGYVRPSDSTYKFQWKVATGGQEGYEVRWGGLGGVWSDPMDVPGGVSTSLSQSIWFKPNTVQYWQVRSYKTATIGKVYSAWTAPRAINILPDPPDMTGNMPAAFSTTTNLRPVFSWTAIEGPARYDIQLSKFAQCAAPYLTATVPSNTYTPATDLSKETTIYWHVRSRASYGVSAWADCQSFGTSRQVPAPALLSPGIGATLPLAKPFNPLLQWSATQSDQFGGYILQVSNTGKFTGEQLEKTISTAEYQATGYPWPEDEDLATGTYYWRVRAFIKPDDFTSYSNWSAVRSFKTPASVTVKVTDAFNKQPIAGARVIIKSANVGGSNLDQTAGPTGEVTFPISASGYRTLIVQEDKYTQVSKTITIAAGGVRTFSVAMNPLPIKLVLKWNNPWYDEYDNYWYASELDSNLWLPEGNNYHVHYGLRGSLTAHPFANETMKYPAWFPPEVTTIAKHYDGKYVFSVYWWNGSDYYLQDTGARVEVWRGPKLINTIYVSNAADGSPGSTKYWWHVLTMDGKNGDIVFDNTVYSFDDFTPPYAPYPRSVMETRVLPPKGQ